MTAKKQQHAIKTIFLSISFMYWNKVVIGNTPFDIYTGVQSCDNHILKTYKIFFSKRAQNVLICSRLCRLNEDCAAFAFDSYNKGCHLSYALSTSCSDLEAMDGVTTYKVATLLLSQISNFGHKEKVRDTVLGLPIKAFSITPSEMQLKPVISWRNGY